MPLPKRVLVVGEINVDLVLQGYHDFPIVGREVIVDDFVMTVGSASAICAIGLAKLGTPVAFAGIVGADFWGDYCLDVMRRAGVDVLPVRRDSRFRTGVTVSITSSADRALVTYLGSIGALEAADIHDALLGRADHLHISSYFLQTSLRCGCADLLRRASRAGDTTSLDPGCDPAGEWGPDLKEALREVDVFLPNEVEIKGITGLDDCGRALSLLDNGRTLTVAKLGSSGAMMRVDGTLLRQPAFPVTAVDTTGAGDSFNAGFLHAWLEGRPPGEALALACACGALATRRLGGIGGQATLEEAEALVRAEAEKAGAR